MAGGSGMSIVYIAAAAALMGGFLFRVRGGLLGDWIRANLWARYGTTGGRMAFSGPVGALDAVWAGDAWLLLLVPALFLGLIDGWSSASDIGRDGDRSRLREFWIMTGRGIEMTAFPALVLWWFGYADWFVWCGAALGLLYEAGRRTPTWSERGFRQGNEISEVYTGAWLSAWLVWAVG